MTDETSTENCCPCGPGGGGEVHYAWDGFDTDRPNIIKWYMVWDDNYCTKDEIAQPVMPDDPSVIFDHYAVEWIEQQADGSVHGILSEREQVCLWPGTTTAKRLFYIGNPIGASFTSSCGPLNARKCGNCHVNTTWCRFNVSVKRNQLASLQTYGGLTWENHKYIASQATALSPTMGITGPLGKGANISTGFRIAEETEPTSLNINAYSPLSSGSGDTIFNTMSNMATSIQGWKDLGILNLEFGGPTVTYRQSIWPNTTASGSTDDPCCNGSDLDYLHDNECSGVCCGDGIVVTYIIPTTSVECYIKQSGGLGIIKTNVEASSLSFIPTNYIPVEEQIPVGAIDEILLPQTTTNNQIVQPVNYIPLENYPTTNCNTENTHCSQLANIAPLIDGPVIYGYPVSTTLSNGQVQHKILIKNPATPNLTQELIVPLSAVKPIVRFFEERGCKFLQKTPCTAKGYVWNNTTGACNTGTCC